VDVLDVLRQPFEDKLGTSRWAQGSLTFLVGFRLVGEMNLFPYGYTQ
jgi:predicted ATPase with chaperone activity